MHRFNNKYFLSKKPKANPQTLLIPKTYPHPQNDIRVIFRLNCKKNKKAHKFLTSAIFTEHK